MHEHGILRNTSRSRLSIHSLLPYPAADETPECFDLSKKEVFTIVYNKLYPFAFFFANKIVHKEDAADIVMSVFSKLWVQKKKFENLSHVKAYLRVAVQNTCINHLRNDSNRARKQEIVYDALYGDETDSMFMEEEIGAEKLSRIFIEIEKLPQRNREIFKMAYCQNLKNPEIARKLGITTRTVQNQKCTALKILRMTLLSFFILLQYTEIPLVIFR